MGEVESLEPLVTPALHVQGRREEDIGWRGRQQQEEGQSYELL